MKNYPEFADTPKRFQDNLQTDLRKQLREGEPVVPSAIIEQVQQWPNLSITDQIGILKHLAPAHQLSYWLRDAHLLTERQWITRRVNEGMKDEYAEWMARCAGYIPDVGEAVHMLPGANKNEMRENARLLGYRIAKERGQQRSADGVVTALERYANHYRGKEKETELRHPIDMQRMKFRLNLWQTMVAQGVKRHYLTQQWGIKPGVLNEHFTINMKPKFMWVSTANDLLRTLSLDTGQPFAREYLSLYETPEVALNQITEANVTAERDNPHGSRDAHRELDNRQHRARTDMVHRAGGGYTNHPLLAAELETIISDLGITQHIESGDLARRVLACRQLYGSPPLSVGLPY